MRYYFDTVDPSGSRRDGVGVDCPSDNSARRLARKALGEMFSESFNEGDETYGISVRDNAGATVFAGTLAYRRYLTSL